MDNNELMDIITKRYEKAKMDCENGVAKTIARLSQGFPRYTHLFLCDPTPI